MYINSKALELGGLDGARNILTINEDGSGTYIQNAKESLLDSSINCVLQNTATSTDVIKFEIRNLNGKTGSDTTNILCNNNASKLIYSINEEGVFLAQTGNVWYSILKTKLETQDVEGLKKYIQQNKTYIFYPLATPETTHIPKELMPTVLTQLQNTFSFGDAIKPSSATINVPTTDDIRKSYSQTLLNGFTQTTGTATPVVNLLNNGNVRLQMDLTAPSTGMNATIFTLPLELRPITTQKIPIFVNGVCQLATIDKTTGNVNLASVPSASANVYIKTDYRRDI